MALINCKECGKEVSDKANACPNCGAPVENENTVHGNSLKVGIEVAKDPNTVTYYNCNIYNITNGNKIKIAQCKEKQSITIDCAENMLLLFDFDLRQKQCEVVPGKNYRVNFEKGFLCSKMFIEEVDSIVEPIQEFQKIDMAENSAINNENNTNILGIIIGIIIFVAGVYSMMNGTSKMLDNNDKVQYNEKDDTYTIELYNSYDY